MEPESGTVGRGKEGARKEARRLLRRTGGPASLHNPSSLPATLPPITNPQLHDVRIHFGTHLS